MMVIMHVLVFNISLISTKGEVFTIICDDAQVGI